MIWVVKFFEYSLISIYGFMPLCLCIIILWALIEGIIGVFK